jgi:cobalt/nickel transport system permease protein
MVGPEIERFAKLDSSIHRWDPRWKIATLLALMLLLGLDVRGSAAGPSPTDIPPALAGLALSACLVTLARIPWSHVLRRLRGPGVLIAIIALVFALSYPGDRLEIGWVRLSVDGLIAALLIALRVLSIILLVFPAFGTAPFHASAKALRSLRVPEALVQTMLFSYRYLFVYSEQLRKMNAALRARGFRPRPDAHTLRTLGRGIGVLIVGTVERTERIQGAMRCRGFTSAFPVSSDLRSKPSDALLSAAVLAAGLAVLAWKTAA